MESFQQFAAVIGVLGLLLAALWWLKQRGYASGSAFAGGRLIGRFRSSSGNRTMQAIERLPLSATHSLHLVRVADRAILIATSPAGCQVVESHPWERMRRVPEAE